MTMLRSRSAGWAVSPMLVAISVLGVAAAVVIVEVGENEQIHRSIPAVLSATVALERPGQPTARGVLARRQANNLALLVNRLGQPPGDGGCSEFAGYDDVITFTTSSGPIILDRTSCSGVSISSHGEDWGATKYDGNGVIEPALRRDLPNLPWARLNRSSP